MRLFTVYPQGGEAAPNYAIKATYPEPDRAQRYGALQVCTGWTAHRVMEQFRRIGRPDAVARLARALADDVAVTIEMGRQELMDWHRA